MEEVVLIEGWKDKPMMSIEEWINGQRDID